MNRNQEVMNSLRAKFEERDKAQKYVMSAEDNKAYETALKNGDIQLALSIKTGMATRQKMNEQLNAELENIDIKSVVKELGTIQPKVKDVNKAINSTAEELERNIKDEYNREEQQLFRRGQSKGGRLHILLQAEYVNKLNAIDEHEEIQKLQSQLYTLQAREVQLRYMTEKYKEDNADLINELRKEQIRKNLQELGLVD
jgi:hypothetical protein